MKNKIPDATPVKTGDKLCKCCGNRYLKAEMRKIGLLHHGLYYVNCAGCHSTLVAKELENEDQKINLNRARTVDENRRDSEKRT